jgi:hypothetical protein
LVPTLTPTQTNKSATSTTPPDPYPLIIPTANLTQENKLLELVGLEECELPCYMGLTPGKSSWEETRKILAEIGAWSWLEAYDIKNPDYDIRENGWPIYSFHSKIGDPAWVNITPDPYKGEVDWLIRQSLDFTVNNDIVERIQVSLSIPSNTGFGELYRKNWWVRYSLEQVLKQLGKPDRIYFQWEPQWVPNYNIYLVYDEVSAVFGYSGLRKDNTGSLICPLTPIEEGQVIRQEIILTNSSSPLDIYAPGRAPIPDVPNQYQPIEVILGIDETTFFNRILDDPIACFEVIEPQE